MRQFSCKKGGMTGVSVLRLLAAVTEEVVRSILLQQDVVLHGGVGA